MKSEQQNAQTNTVSSNDLLAEIEQLRETNRRLHRRVQVDENTPLFSRGSSWGYSRGVKNTEERLTKEFEKRMADYKNATRKEMRRLRDMANDLNQGER